MDIRSACVVGAGRVGTAIAARLGESLPTRARPGAISNRGRRRPRPALRARPSRSPRSPPPFRPGPWIAHTSGACTLDALAPHARRFSLHPLQTFTLDRGPEQLDGAWAARDGRDSRGARGRVRAGEPPRARALPARRRRPAALPRRRHGRRRLPRDAARGRRRISCAWRARRRRRSSRSCAGRWRTGSPPTGPARPGGLGDRRAAPGRDPRVPGPSYEPRLPRSVRGDERGGLPMRRARTIAGVRAALEPLRRGSDRARPDDGRAPQGPRLRSSLPHDANATPSSRASS